MPFLFPEVKDTPEFSMHVISSCNIAVEKNSFVLKKRVTKRYTLIENILLKIKKK